jgi:hypothetical protein
MENDTGFLAKSTNWVAVLAPLLTWWLTAIGVPIPGEALAALVVQSAATLVSRNRKAIMRQARRLR